MHRGINLEIAAEWNRRAVLHILRSTDLVTHQDIARLTGLTVPTIGNILRSLVDTGFAVEEARIRGRRGQPPRQLRLVAERLVSIGVEASSEEARLVLVDMRGRVLGRQSTSIEDWHRSAGWRLVQVLKEAEASIDRLLGVAVVQASNGYEQSEKGKAGYALGGFAPSALRPTFPLLPIDLGAALACMGASLQLDGPAARSLYLHVSREPFVGLLVQGNRQNRFVELVDTFGSTRSSERSCFSEMWNQIVNSEVSNVARTMIHLFITRFGSCFPRRIHIGGHLSDARGNQLADALSTLLGEDALVTPVPSAEYAIATGAALSLFEDTTMPYRLLEAIPFAKLRS